MKKTITRTLLALSAGTLAVGTIAYAQMPAPPAGAPRPTMDANGDGVVTRAEAMAGAEALFARLDVNKDGKLDQADREAHMAEMKAKMFARLDANGDGSISRAEFMAADPMMGHHGDKDGPGKDAPDGPPPPPPGGDMAAMDHGGPDGAPGGPGGHRGMGGGMGGAMMLLKMADANNDGTVTKAEFMAAAAKHFDTADANHDGKITKEEREAMHKGMGGGWKGRHGDRDGPAGPGGPGAPDGPDDGE